MTRGRNDLGELQARLGYRFRDADLLGEALTHSSAGSRRDNQRLEFLGDALLNFTVAFLLHRERPDWQEGAMSKLRGVLVRTDALHAWALDLGLDAALRAAHPRKAPPMGPKPLADALEALLAAVYLDALAGGEDGTLPVRTLVEARFMESIRQAQPESWTRTDPKTHLQETAARLGLPAPVYDQIGLAGPGHAPRFTMRVSVGTVSAEAEGPTRKGAEGDAARQLLTRLGNPTQA
ncbi:MAG: ribonuclease III [Geothrix sp.]|uniref:ribonuclease III family protein n=1 Tax=Geothrix sp. TaxID=1962974 RepID=UPI001859F120|nr:ribonuclease III domain-containing protein [Geothrix sp.]NWJ41159.1 ribonuclease III [Geothrix sp.]WIL20849.1 MAG: putative dsRNA-binding protein [Geothrix sp.]